MGVIAKDDRKITLYYNSETSLGSQTLAYVKASKKKLQTIDISKTKVTGTQWAEIADNLEINISDLIDVEHPDFVKNYGKQHLEMSQHDWLKLLDQTPKVLTYPIVIHGNRFLQIKNPSDFVKFLEPDSAGLEMS